MLTALLAWTLSARAADVDGDTYDSAVDCDDADPAVHPDQPESCELDVQIDTDCNGDINSADGYAALEDWISGAHPEAYIDEDLDGYGSGSFAAIPACAIAPGYVSNDVDCDDSAPDVHPNAPELCDGVDQDCDQAIDEASPSDPLDPDASGCEPAYIDEDGDGYGDITEELCLCFPADGSAPAHEGASYSRFYGDCYDGADFGATIKPLSCEDGFDNDGDGSSDADDLDCGDGLDESGSVKEERFEILDGHDNDCDGHVPAVELDCDDDRSLPLLPVEGAAARPERISSAEEAGLAYCDDAGATREISCWNTTLSLDCDQVEAAVDEDGDVVTSGTGLWTLKLVDGAFDGRYDGGARVYTSVPAEGSCSTEAGSSDCDDHCSSRCETYAPEVCDALDNDCSNVDPGADDDGIPDALDPDVALAGSVSPAEVDDDSDGMLDCADFPSNRDETSTTAATCSAQVSGGDHNDCDDADPALQGDCPDAEPAVEDDGEGADPKGCSVAPRGSGLGAGFLAGLLGLALRRRR